MLRARVLSQWEMGEVDVLVSVGGGPRHHLAALAHGRERLLDHRLLRALFQQLERALQQALARQEGVAVVVAGAQDVQQSGARSARVRGLDAEFACHPVRRGEAETRDLIGQGEGIGPDPRLAVGSEGRDHRRRLPGAQAEPAQEGVGLVGS